MTNNLFASRTPSNRYDVEIVCPCCDRIQVLWNCAGTVHVRSCPSCQVPFGEFEWSGASYDIRVDRSVFRAVGDVAGPLRRLGLIR